MHVFSPFQARTLPLFLELEWLPINPCLKTTNSVSPTIRGLNIARLGSRVGTVVKALASQQCGPGSIPGLGAICGLSLLLVFFSAPRGFSPGTPVFP